MGTHKFEVEEAKPPVPERSAEELEEEVHAVLADLLVEVVVLRQVLQHEKTNAHTATRQQTGAEGKT